MGITALLTLAWLGLAQGPGRAPAAGPFELMVGSPAPALGVSGWLKGEPVPRFEEGRTYVVHFWATWSIPSIRGFEHLSLLQQRYPESLVVIGVDACESKPESVAPYVERMGERMGFRVATDEITTPAPAEYANKSRWNQVHGASARAWIQASGRSDEPLPLAFLVDASGRVAWIGDPAALDEPLEAVLAGTWNLSQAADAYRKRMLLRLQTRPIRAQLEAAKQRRDWESVVGFIDELSALDPEGSSELVSVKFQALLIDLKRTEEAYDCAREAVTNLARDSVEALSQIAWIIAYRGDPTPAQLELAKVIVTRADTLADSQNGFVLDAMARLHYLSGDLDLAVATETLALGKVNDEAERKAFGKRLEQYEDARSR